MTIIGITGYYTSITNSQFIFKNSQNSSNTAINKIEYSNFPNIYHSCNLIKRDLNQYLPNVQSCFQSKSGVPDLIIVGDSHAEHLFTGIASNLSNLNIAYYTKYYLPVYHGEQFQPLFEAIVAQKEIQIVLLSARWMNRFNNDIAFIGNSLTFREAMKETINFLTQSGKKVYVINDSPSFTFDPNQCVAKRLFFDRKCKEPSELSNPTYPEVMSALQYATFSNDASTLIDINQFFCFEGFCRSNPEGINLFTDANHFNEFGSDFVAHQIIRLYPELSSVHKSKNN